MMDIMACTQDSHPCKEDIVMKAPSLVPLKTIFVQVAVSLLLIVAFALVATAQLTYEKKSGVFVDPRNKQKIVGYIKIASAWGEQLRPPQDLSRGIINLKEAMNRYTKIETELDDHLVLSSERLFKMPFVYVTSKEAFQLTETERENLRMYFDMGGFMVVENTAPEVGDFSKGGASLRQMLRDVIPNARFAPIPNSHGIYHSFFDFNDGPPQGIEGESYVNPSLKEINKQREKDGLSTIPEIPIEQKKTYFLEGVYHKGRLAAIYSDKAYIRKWNDTSNNEPQLRMGVNLIVYSLIQDGGIGEKY